jgi:hypothetical protein
MHLHQASAALLLLLLLLLQLRLMCVVAALLNVAVAHGFDMLLRTEQWLEVESTAVVTIC